jgi:hypothetical protein
VSHNGGANAPADSELVKVVVLPAEGGLQDAMEKWERGCISHHRLLERFVGTPSKRRTATYQMTGARSRRRARVG